jgi:iron-sulfur cluster assembly protein
MTVHLTENAKNRIIHYLQDKKSVIGIRLGVKKTGCSGFSFYIDYAEKKHENDEVIPCDDVQIFVDKESYKIANGTTVDFVKNGFQEAFKFSNSKIKSECGCGESFQIE